MKETNGRTLFILLCQLALVLILLVGITGCNRGRSGAQDGEVTITFRTWFPDPSVWDDLLIPAWDAKRTGIKAEIVQVAYSDHFPSLKVSMASGEGPDMIGLQTGAPLEEFQEFLLDITPRAVQTWGSNWERQWFPSIMSLVKGKIDGYYGLPIGSSHAGHIWANMAYFNKYNLRVPTNYNELLAVTRTFRTNGELPLLIGARDDWINLDVFINIVSDINGQKFFDAIEGRSSFTDPDIIQALTIWKNLFDQGIFQDGALGVNVYSDVTSIFEDEKLAPMYCNGDWSVSDLDRAGGVFEIFTMDWNNDGKPAPVAPTVSIVFSINKESKHMEETWQFYSWFTTEGSRPLMDYYLYIPTLVDQVVDVSRLSPDTQKNFANAQQIANDRAAFYREISYPRLRQTLADQLKAVALGESTPQRAAEIIEAASRVERR